MKKIFATLLVFAFVSAAFSQGSDAPNLRFSMRLTPTISWFTTDEVGLADPDGAAMGYSFGLDGDWFFTDKYALNTGVFMDALGGKINYGPDMVVFANNEGFIDVNGVATLRPTYLEIPIGFKFLTKEFWRMHFVGQCGYNQFLLLNAKIRQEGEWDKKDVTDEFTRLMSAYHFGFSVEYSLGGDAYLTGGVVATIGLHDVTKSKFNGVDPVNKLNMINLKIGIIF